MWYMTEERELMVNIAKEFTEKEVKPFIPEMEKNHTYPRHLIKRMGELGFFSLIVPEEAGGIGPDWVTYGLILEEIAKESSTVSTLCLCTGALGIYSLYKLATPEQIENWVKPAVKGDVNLAVSITEACGIFNWTEYQTRAILDGDSWVINGGKIFCTGVGNAEYYLVCCQTSTPNPATFEGNSFIVVPADAPGFEVGHIENKIGWHGSATGSLNFKNCRVPKENLLGPKDQIMPIILKGLNAEFASFGSVFLGASEGVLDKTLKYTKERLQLGVSLYDNFQVVRSTLAQMWADVEMFRGSVYLILDMFTKDMEVTPQATALKANGSRLFESVSSKCIELHGGNGTVVETGIERYMRDAKAGVIGGGSAPTLYDWITNFI